MQSPSPQMGEAGFKDAVSFPRKMGAEQPVLTMEQLIQEMPCGALLCPRLRGKGGADRHQRGPLEGGIHTGA